MHGAEFYILYKDFVRKNVGSSEVIQEFDDLPVWRGLRTRISYFQSINIKEKEQN